MSTRKLTFFSTQTSKKESLEVPVGASWGEIKASFGSRMDIASKNLVLSGSNLVVDYKVDSAIIPGDQDTVIFVYPKESKGGMGTRPKAKKKAKKVVRKAAKKAKKAAKKSKKKVSRPVKKVVKKAKKRDRSGYIRPSRRKNPAPEVKGPIANTIHNLEANRIAEERKLREEGEKIRREFGFRS